MNSVVPIVIGIVALAAEARASEPTVALGNALSNSAANIQEACPEDLICLDSWFRYRVKIRSVLAGPKINGTVTAVARQHAQRILQKRVVSLFVLTAIESSEERKRLGANYIINEYARPETIYCVRKGAEKYGFHNLEKRGLVSPERPDSICVNAADLEDDT